MRLTRLTSATCIAAILACSFAVQSGAQETARRRAPVVRIYSESGADVIGTTNYVTPAIQVSENAYVFAVAMDLDGQIRVLHPDFPGLSVKLVANRQVRLPNFFAGFNQPMAGDVYSSAAYSGYSSNSGYLDARGTVIALASRAPFDLDKIEVDGDWNMVVIRRLIDGRSPLAAAQALAAYIGAKGEPIGRDFMRFAGARDYYAAYGYSAYDACDSYYGFAYSPLRRAQLFAYINYLNQRGGGYRILGYDLCGFPIVVPAHQSFGTQLPGIKRPRTPGDTTVFPKARFPQEGFRRHPRDAGTNAAAEGTFPLPRRSGLPQMGDVTITAPTGRRAEPREILEGYRFQPGTSIPQGRAPIERTVTPRTEPAAATGAPPVRDYRPEPRVESPPPSRMPDPPRAAPVTPPVVHEAPSSPPPPRAATPVTNSESPRTPPPNRR